jgi:hypothetical protein
MAGWARDPIRAAGGRRRYNKQRQDQARVRRAAIATYLAESGISLLARGAQRELAERFEVSPATMSQDLRVIFGTPHKARPRCPFCGSAPIDASGAEAVANGIPESAISGSSAMRTTEALS